MDKKQLIIPVLTLLLCASVIVGVGYGLTTSVTNSNNDANLTEYTIDLQDASSKPYINLAFDAGNIDYSTDITVTADGTKSTKYTVAAGQTVTLNDDGIKLVASHAGTVAVTISDTNGSLEAFFGTTGLTMTIGGTSVTLTHGGSQYTGSIDNIGDGVVILTGTTVLQNGVSDKPSFGTFDVGFVLTPTA